MAALGEPETVIEIQPVESPVPAREPAPSELPEYDPEEELVDVEA